MDAMTPLTVSAFVEKINELLETQVAWVEGEVTDFRGFSRETLVFFDIKDEAGKIHSSLRGAAVVKNIGTKLITQKPPKPYNTTSFLADVYRYFGHSPQQGLAIAESLYQAGMISYPRT
ncbi:MAG: DNA topoisomerase I, partial [Parcubacteria group bacterium Gr01-1014_106]